MDVIANQHGQMEKKTMTSEVVKEVMIPLYACSNSGSDGRFDMVAGKDMGQRMWVSLMGPLVQCEWRVNASIWGNGI